MGKSPIYCLQTIRAVVVRVRVIIIRETLSLVATITCPRTGCSQGIVDLDGNWGLFPGSCHCRWGVCVLEDGYMPDEVSA